MHVYTVIPNQSLPVEKITVRSKGYLIVIPLFLLVLAAAFFRLCPKISHLTASDASVLVSIVLFCLIGLFRHAMAFGRKIEFSKEGITVSFLLFSRSYKWSEINFRVEDYENAIGYRQPWKKGMVFSKRKIRKPIWLHSADYNSLFQPFSFFYVNFDPHKTYRRDEFKPLDAYVVEESVFCDALKQWGVNVDTQP